jgi:hypothetical protein
MHYARFQNVQKSYPQLSILCSRKLFATRIFHVIQPARSSILVKTQAIVIKIDCRSYSQVMHKLENIGNYARKHMAEPKPVMTPRRYAATNKSWRKSNKESAKKSGVRYWRTSNSRRVEQLAGSID